MKGSMFKIHPMPHQTPIKGIRMSVTPGNIYPPKCIRDIIYVCPTIGIVVKNVIMKSMRYEQPMLTLV